MKLMVVLALWLSTSVRADRPDYRFPSNFYFGTASSAYQVEGAWDEDGKGESIWDHLIHENPDLVADHNSGDVACDSYHKFREDVRLMKDMGVVFYRFSMSWPRILPNGTADYVSQAGIEYYRNLISELLDNGILPFVTMYHWDLPQVLQDEFGGWPNRILADYFVDYARVLFHNFGDVVKHWMTFNEIISICVGGYGIGYGAPLILDSGVSDYQCAHTILLAHAKTYHMYVNEYKDKQLGQIGAAFDSAWAEPSDPDSEADKNAAEVALEMNYGWFLDPIAFGNYPDIMISRIRNISLTQGFNESRLPSFTEEEQAMLKGSFDFMGLNYYSAFKVNSTELPIGTQPDRFADIGVTTYKDPSWNGSASDWLKVTPWSIAEMLVWVKNRYGNPFVLITENGFSDTGELEDYDRANFFKQYLYEIARAINEYGCNVWGHTAWSLTDNFEWLAGYTQRFGLHHVDFDDPEKPRTRKLSSYVLQNIIETKHVDWDYYPDWPPTQN